MKTLCSPLYPQFDALINNIPLLSPNRKIWFPLCLLVCRILSNTNHLKTRSTFQISSSIVSWNCSDLTKIGSLSWLILPYSTKMEVAELTLEAHASFILQESIYWVQWTGISTHRVLVAKSFFLWIDWRMISYDESRAKDMTLSEKNQILNFYKSNSSCSLSYLPTTRVHLSDKYQDQNSCINLIGILLTTITDIWIWVLCGFIQLWIV